MVIYVYYNIRFVNNLALILLKNGLFFKVIRELQGLQLIWRVGEW